MNNITIMKANNAVVSTKTTRWLYAISISVLTTVLVALVAGVVIYFTVFNKSNTSLSSKSNNTTNSIFNINITYNASYYSNNCKIFKIIYI